MPNPDELDPDTEFTVYDGKLRIMKDRLAMLDAETKRAMISKRLTDEERTARLAQLKGKIEFTNAKIAEYQSILDANDSDEKRFKEQGL